MPGYGVIRVKRERNREIERETEKEEYKLLT